MIFKLITFLIVFTNICGAKTIFNIGGLFHEVNTEEQYAFEAAIQQVNMENREYEFNAIIKFIDATNGFKAHKAICELADQSVVAIFGPTSSKTIGITESMCTTLGIPHFIGVWQPEPIDFYRPRNMTINLYPDSNLLARAYENFLIDSSWKGYNILYDDDEGLMRLKGVLEVHQTDSLPITIQQLGNGNDIRYVLKMVQSTGSPVLDTIVECKPELISEILHYAPAFGMVGDYQRFLFTSLNTHTVPILENKDMVGTNISTLRLVNPESSLMESATYEIIQIGRKYNKLYEMTAEQLKVEPMLMYDAVKLFNYAFGEVYKNVENFNPPKMYTCASDDDDAMWMTGPEILKEIFKLKSFEGTTGPMLFSDGGIRQHFELDVLEFYQNKITNIAKWTPPGVIKSLRTQSEIEYLDNESLSGRRIRVVSRLEKPYLAYIKDKDGNDVIGQYEGYVVDLVQAMAKELNFTFSISHVPDGNFGKRDPITKEWNGVVRYIMDRKADMAVCDLTITYERRTVIDFTMPFMKLGISILFAKPEAEETNLFKFLMPLSLPVWLYIGVAIFALTILLVFLGRMCPDEWTNPHPCNLDSNERENIWVMKNCMWLVIGSLMGQGCDILPKGIATRLVCGMWWFFALIMLASYTANLAAFLTNERMGSTIENVEQLAIQNTVKYGCVANGATQAFFRESKSPLYQKMWANMESTRPTVFTDKNEQGAERVEKSKETYAFFMESSMIEYMVQRNCMLTQIGGELDAKNYGIAVPMNSKYRTVLNTAILRLGEHGKLEELKKLWWEKKFGGGKCSMEKHTDDTAAELDVSNVGGVFVVLIGGCLSGLIIGILEFLWHVKDVAIEQKVTPYEAFREELRFALQLRTTTKPVFLQISEDSVYSKESNESYTNSNLTNRSKS